MQAKILKILQQDARRTAHEIGIMLNLDPDQVQAEIAAMEEERILLQYRAMINWEKFGVDRVIAQIEVKVTPQREVGFDQIARRLYRFPQVKSLFLLSGSYDLQVIVDGGSIQEVASFVAEKLATIENVQSTVTHFILKKYKEDGVLYEDTEEDFRQVISP